MFSLQNIDHLREIEVVKQLGNILKTNVRGCKSVGHPFVTQLGRIYLDMLNVYRCLSENISVAIAENGEIVTKQPLIRAMRTVKTETLRLISTWVSKSNDAKLVCDNFIPPLLDAVLGDYQRNVPNAREPEVLSTMATFVNKLEVCVNIHLLSCSEVPQKIVDKIKDTVWASCCFPLNLTLLIFILLTWPREVRMSRKTENSIWSTTVLQFRHWSMQMTHGIHLICFSFSQRNVTEHIPKIFDAVFKCTLEMINKVSKESVNICRWAVMLLLPCICAYYTIIFIFVFCLLCCFRTLRSSLSTEQTFSSFFRPWCNTVFKVIESSMWSTLEIPCIVLFMSKKCMFVFKGANTAIVLSTTCRCHSYWNVVQFRVVVLPKQLRLVQVHSTLPNSSQT